MRCRACHARLTPADNYCRKCGAAIEYIDTQVVRTAPAGPAATLRAAALPVVRQSATVVVAGTLLRVALKYWLDGRNARRGLSLLPHDGGNDDVEEVLFYRRFRSR